MNLTNVNSPLKLENGVEIPCVGYGTFRTDPAVTARAVQDAVEAGYRHIDTAKVYGNEERVGEGIRLSGVPREKLTGTIRRRNTTIHSAQVIQRGARLSTTRSSSTQSAAIPPVTLMLSTVCRRALIASLLPAIIAQELFNLLRFLAGDSAAL